MLYRRVAQHVKDQNWFAVGIDFLIVVVGVFVGVQIGNWNQSGQQQRLFDESFDRAIVELQTNLAVIESEVSALAEWLPVVQLAIEDLRTCRNDPQARAHIEAAFAPIGLLPAFNLDTKALDQLINNDSFLPYQTPDQRNRLMALSTRLNTLYGNSIRMGERHALSEKDTSHIVQPGPLVFEGPEQIVDAIQAGAIGSPEMVRRQTLTVPLEAACQDEAFLDAFYAWEDVAYYHSVMGTFASAQVRSDLVALGRPVVEPVADATP